MFNVFIRNWYRPNADWPNGLEPNAGRKTYIAKRIETEEEAREICRDYNDNHDAGPLSRKAEYEEA